MTEIIALIVVGLAAVLGYRFWTTTAELAGWSKVLARVVTVGTGLGLAFLALNWTRSPNPDTIISGWPFPVIGSYKLTDIGEDLWHIGIMDSFIAGLAGNVALAMVVAFVIGGYAVKRKRRNGPSHPIVKRVPNRNP